MKTLKETIYAMEYVTSAAGAVVELYNHAMLTTHI